MNWNDHGHPIWRLLRLTVCLVALTVILWAQATNFDETELQVLFWFFLAAISAESLPELTKRIRTRNK